MDSFTRYAGLEDKTVFVTGGGSGIGASIVEHFCQQGSRVVFVDIAIEASAALVERIAESGARRPEFIECDLTDVVALRRVIVGVPDRHGSVTVLVNNAANDDRHAVADVTPEYWDNRMAVNLRHQFFAAQAVYPQMKEAGGGSIINFGSTSWKIGLGGMPGYTTAKAAISGMTRGLARDFGPDGIRVNALVPGAVFTERQLELWYDDEDDVQEVLGFQCLKECIYPPDVARFVLFLASDESRMCTSQEYVIDGGWI